MGLVSRRIMTLRRLMSSTAKLPAHATLRSAVEGHNDSLCNPAPVRARFQIHLDSMARSSSVWAAALSPVTLVNRTGRQAGCSLVARGDREAAGNAILRMWVDESASAYRVGGHLDTKIDPMAMPSLGSSPGFDHSEVVIGVTHKRSRSAIWETRSRPSASLQTRPQITRPIERHAELAKV